MTWPGLNGDYTVYGRVIKGMDVVDAMVAEETDESDAPLERIAIEVSLVRMTREQIEAANDGDVLVLVVM